MCTSPAWYRYYANFCTFLCILSFWYFALNAMKPSFPSGVFQDYHVLTVQSIVLQISIFAYMIHRLVAESFRFSYYRPIKEGRN